jgi:hypothetical protein
MSSIYKDLVESFGYTPVMEAISLDAIMAAVGQEKDEQKRASALNDIAWKENLPGLYDPVSGNFVRKQSMPARSGGRYDIAATASSGADKELAGRGLVPNNASTSTALGRMFRGDDKKQYDQDVISRSQAARGEKPPGQGAQPEPDKISGVNGAPNISAPGSEYGTDATFAAKANDDLKDLDIGFGPGKMTPDADKPTPAPTTGGDLAAKRKRYAELLAKAKGGTPSQASVRKVDNAIDAKNTAPTSNTKSNSSTLVAGIPVVPGQPLNPVQAATAKMSLDMGNKLSPEVQAAYDLVINKSTAPKAAEPAPTKTASGVPVSNW